MWDLFSTNLPLLDHSTVQFKIRVKIYHKKLPYFFTKPDVFDDFAKLCWKQFSQPIKMFMITCLIEILFDTAGNKNTPGRGLPYETDGDARRLA